jgi:hypothetical protein
MSEYQYYEFQAIDRPLTEREMGELRSFSSRATITPTRFVNHYEWGSFKGNPSAWMEKYFDAFLYLANWGTHELMLRLPRRVLDLATVKQYCCGESASARVKSEQVILEFRSESESGEWVDEDTGHLASLVPLRADIASGDLRALYLAWLVCVQSGELDEADEEPPCPPGLGRLSAPLEAFVEFMRIDRDLLEVAAAGSPEAVGTALTVEVEHWVSNLPEAEKTSLLVRLIEGNEPHLRAELVRRYRESRTLTSSKAKAAVKRRTVGELLKAAEQRAEERRRREAERAAQERARREQEAAEARERYLAALAQREAEAWREVDALIATKQPGKYDDAVKLLKDLRDIAIRAGRQGEVEARLVRLREQHAKKPRLVARLQAAGLIGTTKEGRL